ncbi:MAG: DUF2513 domain-containing protein [Proteobacteria bacterium]|nr:DUF2513 domain-containing protein [Pseudomonadota bacterium]
MKINYIYLKKIITAICERESHTVTTEDLLDTMNIPDLRSEYDKFFGHLLILKDIGCIEEISPSSKQSLGIIYNTDGLNSYGSCLIRLTSYGYDFLDVLNQPKILEKIKGLGLAAAAEVGKLLLHKLIQ